MKHKRQQLLIIYSTVLLLSGYAESLYAFIGIPNVRHYEPNSYGASLQNWDIEQDATGNLYFANNDGMLSYNGYSWKLHPLPNRTILRSMEIDHRGLIYCGGQNAFGRFEPDATGQWHFHSLKDSIPIEFREFEDVWDMRILGDTVFFRSSGRIYAYSTYFKKVWNDHEYQFLAVMDGIPVAQSIEGRLYHLTDSASVTIKGSRNMIGSLLTGYTADERGGYLLATERDGLFRYAGKEVKSTASDWKNYFTQNRIAAITSLPNGDIAIGTGFNGMLLINPEGQLKYHLHREYGLLSNQVSCLHVGLDGNIWIGLSKGISFAENNSPFTYIRPDGDLEGIGYAVRVHDDKFYFGTNNGLYYTDRVRHVKGLDDIERYEYVIGSKGQVWGLNEAGQNLILSHQNGAFLVNGQTVAPFYSGGTWLLKDRRGSPTLLAGTYFGVFEFSEDLSSYTRLSDMTESSRFLLQDQYGYIWVAHPYRGIYRLSQQADKNWYYELFGPERGLPSHLHNHIFMVNEKILIGAERGVYEFDYEEKRFLPYAPLNKVFGEQTKVRRLTEDDEGNLWYITDTEVGHIIIEDMGLERSLQKEVFPHLKELMNDGWEVIYPYGGEHVFFTSTRGFVHYDPNKIIQGSDSLRMQIHEVRVTGQQDSLLFRGLFYDGITVSSQQPEMQQVVLKQEHNTLLFRFGAIDYRNGSLMSYRYWLEGFDADWSEWSDTRVKEYTRLKPGKYVFNVQATNLSGEYSNIVSYRFEILRPWYSSNLALLLYTGMGAFMLWLIYWLNKRRIRRLEETVALTVTESKSTIERIEKERIEDQLEHKKRELITSTMHLVRKNETLKGILENLVGIEKSSSEQHTRSRLGKLIRLLEQDAVIDQQWEDLLYHFNEVHEDFFKNLKRKYNSLTTKDLKLCAYLRMNLSTKDIALLTNVSPRGIDASRYRLRKKLGLDSDVNLTEFLMKF